MTKDRDFKNVIRRRAAKTGESYQAARRNVEWRGKAGRITTARVNAVFRTPSGVVLGCVVERGELHRGAAVAVVLRDGRVVHEATVRRLRRFKLDVNTVVAGMECGLLLEPPCDDATAHGILA